MKIQFKHLSEGLRNVIKNHGHHLIFGLSILSMTLLIAWWSVFLHNSIKLHRSDQYQKIRLSLDRYATQLGMETGQAPTTGSLEQDGRFEVVVDKNPGVYSHPLIPYWGGYTLRAKKTTIAEIEAEFERKKLMLVGESGLLFLLILLSLIFLYKFIQLERRFTRQVTEFWGRTTHEIKTPITGIKLFLQSLKNRSLDMDNLMPYVELALKQVSRQEQLAENILAGSRLRDKDARLKIMPVNLGIYIKDYFHNALHLANAAVQLNIDPGAEEAAVSADPAALKVIMDNITENAVRYGPAALQLEVRVHADDVRSLIEITDNGPGFPEAHREHIFNSFNTSRHLSSPDYQVTGMGLYISRRLAQKMGGDLLVSESKSNRGASLSILLNRVRQV